MFMKIKNFIQELKETIKNYSGISSPALKDITDYAVLKDNDGMVNDSTTAANNNLTDSKAVPRAGEIWSLWPAVNSEKTSVSFFALITESKENKNYVAAPISFNLHLCCGREILIPAVSSGDFFKKSYMIMCCSKFECSENMLAKKVGEAPRWDILKRVVKTLEIDKEYGAKNPEDIADILVKKEQNSPDFKIINIGLSDNLVFINNIPIIDESLKLDDILSRAYEQGIVILIHRADRYDIVNLIDEYHKYVNYDRMSFFLYNNIHKSPLKIINRYFNSIICAVNEFRMNFAFCASRMIEIPSAIINEIIVYSQQRSNIIGVLEQSDHSENPITLSRVVLRDGGIYYVVKAPDIDLLKDKDGFFIEYTLEFEKPVRLNIDYNERRYKNRFYIIDLNNDILQKIDNSEKRPLNILFVFNIPELNFEDKSNIDGEVKKMTTKIIKDILRYE